MTYNGKKYRLIVNDKHPGKCFGCIFYIDQSTCWQHDCVDDSVYQWYVYYPTLNNNIKVI